MNLIIDVPEDLYQRANRIAALQQLSVETLLREALEREVTSIEWFRAKAARGDVQRFRDALDRVPAVEPPPCDRL